MDGTGRPSFFEAIGLVIRGVIANAGTCVALSAPPALLYAAALAVMGSAGVESSAVSSLSLRGIVAIGFASLAAVGTIVLASAVVYPLSAAGLAWVGTRTVFGRNVGAGEALERLAGRGPRAIGAFLLSVAVVAAGPAAAALVGLILVAVAGPVGGIVAVLLLAVALVYPAFVYWVRFTLVVPLVMAEDVDAPSALGRSAELVRGGFWWVFGLVVVSSLAASLVASLVSAPFGATPGDRPFLFALGQALGLVVSLSVTGVAAGVAYAARSIPVPEPRPEPAPVGPGEPASEHDEDESPSGEWDRRS